MGNLENNNNLIGYYLSEDIIMGIYTDNLELTSMFKKNFNDLKCKAHYTDKLDDVVSLSKKFLLDIIIFDINKEKENFPFVIETIKNMNLTGDTCILGLVNKDDDIYIMDGFEAGIDDYIYKPFKPIYIKSKVRSLIAKIIRRKKHIKIIHSKENSTNTQAQNSNVENRDLIKANLRIKVLESEIKKLSAQKTSTIDHKSLEERDKEIERLSKIIYERSQEKNAKAAQSKLKVPEKDLTKLQIDQMREGIEKIRTELDDNLEEFYKEIQKLIKEFTDFTEYLCDLWDGKNKTMDKKISKHMAIEDELTLEAKKFKRQYFELLNNKEGFAAAEVFEEKRAEKNKAVFDELKEGIKNIEQDYERKQNELKTFIINANGTIKKFTTAIKEKTNTLFTTETSVSKLMLSEYEKEFKDMKSTIDNFNLTLEEKNMQMKITEKKIRDLENKIAFKEMARK